MPNNVAVFGSLNVDVTFSVESFPNPGETLLSRAVSKGAGGKGLNQAVASAKAGAETLLYGAVGEDSDGAFLMACLRDYGISGAGVLRVADAPTGLAHILVDRFGENSIVVAAGANRSASLGAAGFAAAHARVFLAQLEVDLELVRRFLERGRQCGAVTILNAAPASEKALGLLPYCDLLVVNEHELTFYGGAGRSSAVSTDVASIARNLLRRPEQVTLVTLGARGALLVSRDEAIDLPAVPVEPVDTTGAGDCLCGVLAAGIAAGLPTQKAVARAMRAAAIAVTRKGAAAAMPDAAEFDV